MEELKTVLYFATIRGGVSYVCNDADKLSVFLAENFTEEQRSKMIKSTKHYVHCDTARTGMDFINQNMLMGGYFQVVANYDNGDLEILDFDAEMNENNFIHFESIRSLENEKALILSERMLSIFEDVIAIANLDDSDYFKREDIEKETLYRLELNFVRG